MHLSTLEASMHIGVAPLTIRQWVASGRLPCLRRKGRILIPKDAVLNVCGSQVVAYVSPADASLLPDALCVSSWWDLAQRLARQRPTVLLIDLAFGRSLALEAAQSLRALHDRPKILVIAYEDEESMPRGRLWDRMLKRPCDLQGEVERASQT